MEPELVSVVLVTWNSAPYLRRCLEGIRQQTHRAVELIVVDNASSDDRSRSSSACPDADPQRHEPRLQRGRESGHRRGERRVRAAAQSRLLPRAGVHRASA